MENNLDSRAFLDIDDEHGDIKDKYSALELSLNKLCDRMTTILDKIRAAERYVECARRLDSYYLMSLMSHRITILKMAYNTCHQLSQQLADQLLMLESFPLSATDQQTTWGFEARVH